MDAVFGIPVYTACTFNQNGIFGAIFNSVFGSYCAASQVYYDSAGNRYCREGNFNFLMNQFYADGAWLVRNSIGELRGCSPV